MEININILGYCRDYRTEDYIAGIDGWTIDGENIPNIFLDDQSTQQQQPQTTLTEIPLCKKNGDRYFVSTQNIAEIDFYLPFTKTFLYDSPIPPGFAFTVKFIFEPTCKSAVVVVILQIIY